MVCSTSLITLRLEGGGKLGFFQKRIDLVWGLVLISSILDAISLLLNLSENV